MKYIWILVILLCSSIVFAQEEQVDSSSDKKKEKKEQEEQKQEQEQATPAEEPLTGIDLYYSNRGFDLTPKTQALQWTNKFSTSLYYDSNVFLNEGDDRQDDIVWASQLQTDLRYVQQNWQVGINGVFRYEDYYEENSLDQFLPQVSVDFSYRGKIFYFSLKETIARQTAPNTVDLNDRSPWAQNRVDMVTGFQYKQLIFEILSFHAYLDFEDIEGDNHNYGQAYVLKYMWRQNFTFIFEVAWDYINYREAAIVEGDQQSDTLGLKILPGVEISFTKSLYLLLQVGLDHRTSFDYIGVKAFLVWQPTPSLRFTLSGLRQTLPTFAGDFQILGVVGLGIEYLISENMVIKTNSSALHGNPENGQTSYRHDNGVTFTYRILDGIEFEAFATLSVKADSAANFVWLKSGGGLNVVF